MFIILTIVAYVGFSMYKWYVFRPSSPEVTSSIPSGEFMGYQIMYFQCDTVWLGR